MKNLLKKYYKIIRFWGGGYKCIVCGTSVRRYFPFSKELASAAKAQGFPYTFDRMETLNIENCNCPFCLSNDRERLYALFLDKYLQEKSDTEITMLDFAPNPAFTQYFKNKQTLNYHSADLFREDVDLQIDICKMDSIKDDTYDIIICSHILEHVSNPNVALAELYRILKKGGFAILMVPLFWDVEQTVEDKAHTTEEDRCKYYGQNDHVRLYSKKDFISQIKQAGFELKEYGQNHFLPLEIKQNAIASNSILYVGSK